MRRMHLLPYPVTVAVAVLLMIVVVCFAGLYLLKKVLQQLLSDM